MIDLNRIAGRCYDNALKRGKIKSSLPDHQETVETLGEEFMEVVKSKESAWSEHLLDFTETEEELADVLIGCLTELHRRNVDIEVIVTKKIEYNETREFII